MNTLNSDKLPPLLGPVYACCRSGIFCRSLQKHTERNRICSTQAYGGMRWNFF